MSYSILIIQTTSGEAFLCDGLYVGLVHLEFHFCFNYLIFSQWRRHIIVSNCLVELLFLVKCKVRVVHIIVIWWADHCQEFSDAGISSYHYMFGWQRCLWFWIVCCAARLLIKRFDTSACILLLFIFLLGAWFSCLDVLLPLCIKKAKNFSTHDRVSCHLIRISSSLTYLRTWCRAFGLSYKTWALIFLEWCQQLFAIFLSFA